MPFLALPDLSETLGLSFEIFGSSDPGGFKISGLFLGLGASGLVA